MNEIVWQPITASNGHFTWLARFGAGYLVKDVESGNSDPSLAMVYVPDSESLLHLPESCQTRACSYYALYLTRPMANETPLPHEGYHFAVIEAQNHRESDKCQGDNCFMCAAWRTRLHQHD